MDALERGRGGGQKKASKGRFVWKNRFVSLALVAWSTSGKGNAFKEHFITDTYINKSWIPDDVILSFNVQKLYDNICLSHKVGIILYSLL